MYKQALFSKLALRKVRAVFLRMHERAFLVTQIAVGPMSTLDFPFFAFLRLRITELHKPTTITNVVLVIAQVYNSCS